MSVLLARMYWLTLIGCAVNNSIEMLQTFNNLVKRSLNEKTYRYGDPMDVIPIKNAKYARECTEIHLSNRSIEMLINFDKFPNLERLYLNDNLVQPHFDVQH